MTAPPIAPIAATAAGAPSAPGLDAWTAAPRTGAPFAQWLANGVDAVNQKLLSAETAAKSFELDDSIPPHQVTFALEQARLSLELMMQVRARLVEGYQELSRMQL